MQRRSQISVEYDELTDLPNMMYFRRYAGAYVKKAHRVGHNAYLVYFNLENFSVFNERYGFEEGDRLLRLTALVIKEAFPGYLLSRFSEDHFFLVCESLDVERGIHEAHELVRSYGRNANVELKAGVVLLEDEEFDVGMVCDRAKIACESIAHHYDQCLRWFDDALKWYMERSHYVESHIDRAVENDWIKVYLQPIAQTVTGQVCEFEALARWDDPRYGLLSPMIFVEVLERSHLIHKLDGHMIRRSCEIWREMKDKEGIIVPISINLSRLDFKLCDPFQMVEDAVNTYGVPRQMLHLEITESALNENADQLIEEVARFRKAGYQVWLDDFGSGYSSLNTLKDYVFDVVKIDMAFLREFNSKPKSRVIISSIVNMAKQLGMQSLIEGVELPEQFDFLREIGCEFVQGYIIGRPALLQDNLKRIASGEIEIARIDLQGYYNQLGAINPLSTTPFEFPWEIEHSEERIRRAIAPMAIIEREGKRIRIVKATQTFENLMKDIGLISLSKAEAYANDFENPQARVIHDAINVAVASNSIESVDLIEGDVHVVMRMRHVVSRSDVDALLVSVLVISGFTNMSNETRASIATQFLYAVYDEVNIIDIHSGVVSTVYRGNTIFPSAIGEQQFYVAAKGFVNTLVHPDDRERCFDFFDLNDIEQRVESSDRNYIADAFRMLNGKGVYSWITALLIPIMVEGRQTVLLCMRQSNSEVLASMRLEGPITKDLLWDTLLDLLPAGVFWKDADRRFLGVNKNFLDFYSFDSTNDVLGKNDEEMGWHVSADPFKNNELRVIQTGEPVLNTEGTCISQGEVRDIVASKVPLWRNGEVVGLLGYFTDRTHAEEASDSVMNNGFNRLAETDNLTGLLNLRGFTMAALSYMQAFEEGSPDFVYVVLDICDMSNLNNVYGRSFGNRILRVVADRITRLSGTNGVVARVSGSKFAVLRQVSSVEESATVAQRLHKEIENIREVDGTTIHMRCFVGWALFSESGDISGAVTVAEQRLRESAART